MPALLEEIGRPERRGGGTAAGEISLDPELDEFMVQSTELALILLILSIAVGHLALQ